MPRKAKAIQKLPEVPPGRKRAVLMHRDGMQRIIGAFDPSVHEVRPYVELEISGVRVQAGLIRVTNRMLLYREIVGPHGKTMHPSQR